jgi:Carboxypeptidase regulatory-like domain
MGSLHEFWNVRKDEVSYGAHGISVDLHACLAAPAMAQGSKGAIKGHVTDASGSVLQGAEVTLEPRSTVLASDVQGEFFINDLEPGSYTVTVSYVGFKAVTKTVEVVAGQVANVDTKLDVQEQNERVLVTADRVSAEAEAVNRERTPITSSRFCPMM